MSLYLKSSLWDFILVFAAVLGMCYTLLNCFYVAEDLQYGPVPAVVCAAVLIALFAAGANKRIVRVAAPALGVALVVSWIAAASFTPDGAYLVDNESNYLIFAMCATLTPLVCYVLSRRVGFAALLFIAGSFIVALVQFLYQRFDVVWALLFVAASLALIVFKNYQQSMRQSTSVKKAAFAPGFAVAFGMTALAAGLGCGIWFGIVAPLQPPAAEIKLITEYRALETIRVKGIADLFQVPNVDMTSDQTNDGERTTDDIKESETGRQYPVTGSGDAQNEPDDAQSPPSGGFAGINVDVPDDLFDFFTYEQLRIALIIAAIVALCGIAGYFVGRRVRRRRRLERITKLPPSQQVLELYPFFVKKFERLGWGMAPGQTPADYAVANAATIELFDVEANTSFASLTNDYAAVAYGHHELGQDAASRYSSYYNAFWKACRRKLGAFKYFFKSFRL